MISIILLVIAIVFAAGVTFMVYQIIYNKKINEKLKNGESTAHIEMPSLDSIGRVVMIFAAVSIILVILFQLEKIRNDVRVTNEEQHAQIKELMLEIEELRYQMNEQNELVYDFGYSWSDVDTVNNTAKIKFTCKMKKYSQNTKLKYVLGDTEIAFSSKGNGVFEAEETMPLFVDYGYESTFVIENDGMSETQGGDYSVFDAFFQDVLPSMGYEDEANIEIDDGKCHYYGNFCASDDFEGFKDFEFYLAINGERVADVDTDAELRFDGEINCSWDDVVEVFITGTDKYGYVHRQRVVGYNIPSHDVFDSNGEYVDNYYDVPDECIYTQDGVELYGPNTVTY